MWLVDERPSVGATDGSVATDGAGDLLVEL
jgi:hypothetical protein